ncbi:MAG: chorismate synthase [candidate division KSB1 bacterium]|nr:chorismate synthase [candidate division KSB1 bacterium]
MRYFTAGESHGKALVGILEGMPAQVPVRREEIDRQLRRRQAGYGRGGRMAIEQDRVEIVAGVRAGYTTGAPVALIVANRDWQNWQEVMAVEACGQRPEPVTVPRPGHADLAGALKYGHADLRDVIERASARETAMRVALGAIAGELLEQVAIGVVSHVTAIAGHWSRWQATDETPAAAGRRALQWCRRVWAQADKSPVRCLDPEDEKRMIAAIDEAREAGDSVGGVLEVVAVGVPPGLGSYVHWDRRLDGRLAMAVMSIPGIKSVEIGLGSKAADLRGSQVHDEISPRPRRRLARASNRAGGIEGGVSNGQPIVLRAAMKPIPTLARPLRSVDLRDGKPEAALRERADVCAVPAAAVVAEAMVKLVLADAILEKFGGDSLPELLAAYERATVR